MIFPDGVVQWKVFCSFENDDGTNCQNEAVGEVQVITGVVLGNNPLHDNHYSMLPICQMHLDNAKKV
jgi:hypothetical protein